MLSKAKLLIKVEKKVIVGNFFEMKLFSKVEKIIEIVRRKYK